VTTKILPILDVRHVDNAKISSRPGLAQGHARIVLPRTVLPRPTQNVLYLGFVDCMSVDVRFAGFRVDVEANLHHAILLPSVPFPHRPSSIPVSAPDRSDAKGLLEAQRNEQIQPVPVKSIDQQALSALHRLRSAWLAARTCRLNTVRGLLREFGIAIPLGAKRVVPTLQALLEDTDCGLPDSVRPALDEARAEILELERRMPTVELQLRARARQTPVVRKLRTIPGVGLLTATALVALVGNVGRFPSARHFASYLGMTPRERSSFWRRDAEFAEQAPPSWPGARGRPRRGRRYDCSRFRSPSAPFMKRPLAGGVQIRC